MNALPLIAALLTFSGGAQKSKVSLDVYRLDGSTRVAVKPGDKLVGEVTFRVIVQTNNPVQAVEFYVGDDLRDTDGSTPYEFKLDTLAEEDGEIKIRFKGFTTEGENAEKLLAVSIDNGVSLGAAVHVEKGTDYLTNGKTDEAITEGRIALKADKDNVPARVLLARANFSKGIYDKAQKFAEDALALDKGNRGAKEVLISIKVQQAFSVVSRTSGDRREVLNSIKSNLSAAIISRVQLLDDEVEKLAATPESLDYVDAALRARRYSRVIEAIDKKVSSDYKNTELTNRLVYAYLMQSNIAAADLQLKNLKKFGSMDAYSFALASVIAIEQGNDAASDAAIQEALLNNPDSLGVRTAQAYIALKRDRSKALSDAAGQLIKENDNRSEAHYFAAALANRLNQPSQSRRSFEKALRADASDHDMYVEQGNEAILLANTKGVSASDREFQFDYARTMFELALQARPTSGQALSGVAIVTLYQKKYDESLKFAEAATKASPTYAAAWYTYAASLSGKRIDARGALAKASVLDVKNLAGRSMPDADIIFKYFNTTGRMPVLSTPSRG